VGASGGVDGDVVAVSCDVGVAAPAAVVETTVGAEGLVAAVERVGRVVVSEISRATVNINNILPSMGRAIGRTGVDAKNGRHTCQWHPAATEEEHKCWKILLRLRMPS